MKVKGAITDALSVASGAGIGNVARRLIANGMNANALRTNATLRKDEWKEMDKSLVQICKQRMVGVGDLVSRGLTYNIVNGLGTTVLEFESISDMEAAQINMDAATRGAKDRVEFDIGYLPLPITHKDFEISIRVLEASRKLGRPLDTTQVVTAGRKISEKVEEMLFIGASTYTFGGGTIYGYMDHPNRNTVTLSTNWDDYTSDAGAGILDDVIAMKQASIDAKHYGPWIIYAPTNYETTLDKDYSTSYPNVTIRDRIKKIGGIEDVKIADFLTDDNVVMVEMVADTVRMVIGMQPTNVEWETEGGMIFKFKTMTIMVPQIRADQDGNSGIVHLAA